MSTYVNSAASRVQDSDTPGTGLNVIVVSAIARALGSIFKQIVAMTEMMKEAYENQQKLIQIQQKITATYAKDTQNEGQKAADATRAQAVGGIVQGSLGLASEGIGGGLFVKSHIDLKPTSTALQTGQSNQRVFDGAPIPTQAELTTNAVGVPQAADVEAKVRGDIAGDPEKKIITSPVNPKEVEALAANRKAFTEAEKKVADKNKELSEEIHRKESSRDQTTMLFRGLGQGLGNTVNGGMGSKAADAKAEEAKQAAAKTLDQGNQAVMQSNLDSGNKAISSFDSGREALFRAHSEIAASNRA